MYIGAHVSIAGGIDKAPGRAQEIGCECFQIFSRSPRGGKAPLLTNDLLSRYKTEFEKHGLSGSHIHVPYYTNLASDDKKIRDSSIAIIVEELERGDALEAKSVVFHPGSAKKEDPIIGVARVIDCLKEVFTKFHPKISRLLVENTAGQGAVIGHTFDELAVILDKVGIPEFGVCLDTAHLFGSGYDIRTPQGWGNILDEFDSKIGLDKLHLIHANDSKVDLGSRKDRHEHIGKGKIGLEGFRAMIENRKLKDIDVIIETPPEKVAEDIVILKSMHK